MKREFLENLGLETEIVEKIMAENGADIEREKSRTTQAKADLADVQEKLTEREKDLETLRASSGDADAIRKQLEELQTRYTAETDDYKKQLADRDYSDAVNRTISENNVKFTSKGAGAAFVAKLKEQRLAMKDGLLDGFGDFLKVQKEADPDAFQSDKPIPKFVTPTGTGAPPPAMNKGAMFAKMFNQQYSNRKE